MRTWFAKQTIDVPVALPTPAAAEAMSSPKAAIKPRRMVYAPVRASGTEARPEGEIRIKAQLDLDGKQIVLMIDRPILQGYSYCSSNLDDAQRMSPLAAALLERGDVNSVLIHEMNVTVAVDMLSDELAEISARQFGKIIRTHLQSGQAVMTEDFMATMPSEDEIRYGLQSAIDLEINPGIAGHSGEITLTSVVGNTVYIKMGGGCQGCAASSITLRKGVDQSFRNAVPQIGALLDETDHAAGSNPFFTELPSGMRG